ncbi:SRPBCC family protein [Kitasatospora sp. HPMI-4]|uniref:SRPBCC family protein n=1 Tax=Kitasatospora sp. HPMI-4 TaxID=3448443 RepID=UPI003F1BC8B6
MAVRHVLIKRPPDQVWRVLGDPTRYATWVPGTRRTRPSGGDWPDVDASLHYTLAAGPFRLSGRTVVRICEPLRRLELEAYAGPLGSARIAVELVPWGTDTVVIVDEHPLRGVGGGLHIAPTDLLLHLRHRRMLARLSRAVEETSPGTVAPAREHPRQTTASTPGGAA